MTELSVEDIFHEQSVSLKKKDSKVILLKYSIIHLYKSSITCEFTVRF